MTADKPVSLKFKAVVLNLAIPAALAWQFLDGQPPRVLVIVAAVTFPVCNAILFGFGRRAEARRRGLNSSVHNGKRRQ